jgi:hypothetical protein
MRAFEPFNKRYRWNHPEDMKTIIDYLETKGKINIEYRLLEDMYYDYSDSVACGWRCVDDISLEQFAEFLSRVELTPGGYKYIHEYDFEDEDDEEFNMV